MTTTSGSVESLAATPDAERDARRHRRFEILATLLLSAATVLTAWSAYESTRWNGVQATAFSEASASRTESVRASTLAGQQTIADVSAFTAWLTATDEGHSHLADLLAARFRGEFKVAFGAWELTSPLTSSSAPATPFAMPQYQSASSRQATALEALATKQFKQATAASDRGDDYILMTVLFALVLFFGAICTRFELVSIQMSLLIVAGLVFVVTAGITFSYPINI
jgi:hypothetical protein